MTPVYPPDAREKNVAGTVIVDITVDGSGRVSDAKIVRSIPLLDQAALDAVRGWVFEPTLLNGQPVALVLTVTRELHARALTTPEFTCERRSVDCIHDILGRLRIEEMQTRGHRLDKGDVLIIREAVPDDAPRVMAFAEATSRESDFISFGPGEFGTRKATSAPSFATARSPPAVSSSSARSTMRWSAC